MIPRNKTSAPVLRWVQRLLAACAACFLLNGCVSRPSGFEVVSGFDADRYLGKWYEIARLDHSFERGLDNVTAEYSKRREGGLTVLNRGYDDLVSEWRQVKGVAYLRGRQDSGSLKVSFFWPFYGTYDIIILDHEGYSYAVVAGSGRSYLWILARQPALDAELLSSLVRKCEELGFDVSALVYVKHDKAPQR